MNSRAITAWVLALGVAAGTAQASSIGVFTADNGTDCDADVVPFAPFFTYIGAVLGGDAAASGISGAEFRVDGYDAAWFNTSTPNAASNLALANPITGGGNIAFPTCQTGTGGFVLLYTVQSLAFTTVTPHTLHVGKHTTPSNVNFECPLVTICDSPTFTKICVPGGEAFLNTPDRSCTVGVEQKSWTAIKRLYH